MKNSIRRDLVDADYQKTEVACSETCGGFLCTIANYINRRSLKKKINKDKRYDYRLGIIEVYD